MLRAELGSRTSVQRILVIRFGSLGDLILLCWSLARLAQIPDRTQRKVTLVTKGAFAELAARCTGIDEVVPLAGSGAGATHDLASRLRGVPWTRIVDAHNILRGHLLLALLGRRPDVRLDKDTAARLALLWWKKSSPRLERSLRDRFDALFTRLFPAVAEAPVTQPLTPGPIPSDEPILGIAPGAMWPTKRWPETKFTELLQLLRQRRETPIRIFLGPREKAWFDGSSLARFAEDDARTTVWRNRSLVDVAAGLAECACLVTNDSGLLHLAEAVGTPVVALFGPTVRQFGYFPCLPDSQVKEIDIDCRPCSRTGKRACRRGDLACLTAITPDTVLASVLAGPAWRIRSAGENARG